MFDSTSLVRALYASSSSGTPPDMTYVKNNVQCGLFRFFCF